MSFLGIANLGIAGVAVGALVTPIVLKRPGTLPFDAKDIELVSGPRTVRTILAAIFLLSIFCLGIFAVFARHSPDRYWLAFGGSFVALLMIAVILPKGGIRKVFVKALEFHLVASGFAIVVSGIAQLFIAGLEARALLPRARGIWIKLDEEPFIFWYSVIGSGLLMSAALYGLREYFLRIYERRRAD